MSTPSPMFYEAAPEELKQAWKVFWNGRRGGHYDNYQVVKTADDAVKFAKELAEKQKKFVHYSIENIGIERCFILSD